MLYGDREQEGCGRRSSPGEKTTPVFTVTHL
jgi:hypothetical protein